MFIKIKKEGISNICKRYFHYILLIFILNIICPSFVRSEGTREFKGNKKNKCQISFCSSSYSNLASYNSDTNHRLYIHINNPGEIIYYGFTNSYYSSYNYYRIKKPDGSIAVSESYFPSSGQVGYINNIDEAFVGPKQINIGGYNALSYTTTMKGDYYIEFKSSVSFNLFDITVASSTNQPQTGRLWARSWDFSLPDYNTPFEGTAFIYADDGIVTSIQFKELKPCVFTLIANRTGCQKTGNYITDRLSVNGQKNYPQYRIFFNNPDTIAYPSGTYGKLTAPTTLTGCDGNFCLNFSVNKTGPIQILLDLNGVSGYQPNTEDVVITDTARNVGLNCIPWNGKNGKGKPVPANARIFIDVNYFNGLTNLPLYDVESDSTGYYVKLVRPPATDSIPYLFWDDSHIYDSRFGYGSKNLTGCQDLVNGCHQWYYDFGDERTINTWWYANVLKADLLMNLKYASVETNKFLLYGQKSDTTVCLGPTDNTLQLNGYYTEANGAIWSTSGTGTFIPDNTTMNAVYKFSDADISKGSVLLILKTTGTKTGCLDVSDSMPVKIIRTNAFSAGADQTICRGSSATLTASGGSGSSSYSWIPGGVKTASIVVYPTQTTTYNVQINTGNCKAADNVVVTVNSPNISAGADQTICVGASTKLSASGGNTYSWSTSEKTTSITVNPATSKTYYVTGTDNSALACTAVDNVVVNIGPFTTDAGTDQTVCYGESTTLTASGASTFTWSNGDKTGTITLNNLTSTKTFIVTATSGSCTATDSVKVNVIQMNVSAIANPAKICIGGGSVLTASGAVSYEWSTGAIGSDAPVTPKITTTYIVTGTNSGCTGTASVVVNLATSINVGATANPGTLCSGESSVLKGSGANSYSWYTGTVNDSITVSPTETTTYIVKGTSGGCTGTASTVVKYTSSLNVTTTANTTSICLGKNSTITANGADSYSWSTGVSGASITVTPTITTTYYVTGTSGKCTGTSSIVITVNSSIAVSATASPSTICSGSGSVITASGATKYSWSTGPTSASISVKPTTTTTYKVTGTSGSCTGTAMATVTVNANPTVTVKSPSICTGSSATLTASGATTYSWSTSQTVNSISVNPTTNTTYKVTGTTSGCTGTTTATVTVNPLPTISVNSPAICSGKSTTLTAAGGSAYSWSTSQTVNPITVSPTITSTYYVTGTDANSCKNTAQSVVNVASALTVTVNSPTICNGVSATLTANGATTYSWTNSATTNPITVSPTTTTTYKVTGASGSCTGTAMATVTVNANPIVTVNSPSICTGSSATITASGANTYSWSTSQTVNPITVSLTTNTTYKVTGTTSGCTGTAQSVVTVNSNPVVNVNNESICKGGAVILTATGAVTYSWTTAQNINPITVSPATNTTYTVTGNDSNGCSGTAWSIVNVSTVIPNAGTDQTICSGISATINASGATTYSWNNNLGTGASKTVNPTSTTIYTVTGTTGICSGTDNVTIFVDPSFTTSAGADRTITEGQTSTISAVDGNSFVWSSSDKTQSFVAKPSVNTTYIVTAKKATCTATAQVIVTVNPYVKADAGNNQTICIGNSTILTATGGDSYTWSNGNTGTNINVSPTVTTTYYVTANLGTGSDIDSVVVNVIYSIKANAGADQTICYGDSAKLSSTGGNTYTWNTSENTSSITVSPLQTSTYVVSVDYFGCKDNDSIVVFVSSQIMVSAGPDHVICSGDQIRLVASGGDSYNWNTGSSSPVLSVSPTNSTTFVVTAYVGACSASASTVVNVTPPVLAEAGPNQNICYGKTATLTATGGTNYSWDNGEQSATINVSPVSTTIYNVTVQSGKCSAVDNLVVNVDNSVVADAGKDQTICSGSNITLNATGGTTYIWSSGANSQSINVNPNTNTTYIVTVYSNTCSATDNVVIFTGNVLNPDAGADRTVCMGSSTTLTATGGNSYKWSTGDLTNNIIVSPTSTTTYYLTATSGNCSGTDNLVVTVSTNIQASAGADQTICSAGNAKLTASGGDKYYWSNGDKTAITNVSPKITTTYTVTVTSGICQRTDDVVVTIGNGLTVTAGENQTICNGGFAVLNASGGDTYKWSMANGQWSATGQSIIVSPTVTSTYFVTATMGNCTGVSSVIVFVNNNISANAGQDQTICKGASTDLTANGGSLYKWSTGTYGQTVTVNPTLTTTYTLTAFSGTCSATDDIIVTVVTTVIASAGSDQTICPGGRTSLTASGGSSYSWSTGETGQSIYVKPLNSTDYSVTVKENGCYDISTVTVNVGNNLTVYAGPDQTVCTGDTIYLTAPRGYDSYSWNNGKKTQSIAVYPYVTTTYTLFVTSGNCSASDDIVVIPTTILTVNAGQDQTICKNGIGILKATGGKKYLWSTGENTQSIIVVPTTQTKYIVTAISGSCSAQDEVVVSIDTFNPINVSAGSDHTICDIGTVVLTATGGDDYKWSTGANSQSITVSPDLSTNYSVTVSSNTCMGTASSVVFVHKDRSNAGGNQIICLGDNVSLEGSGGQTFKWSTGEDNQVISVSPTITSTYTLTVNDIGCTGTDVAIVEVIQHPQAHSIGLQSEYCINNNDVVLIPLIKGGKYSGDGITGNGNIFSPRKAGAGIAKIVYTYDSTYTKTSQAFYDDFSKDRGWTGYGQGGWQRGPAISGDSCTGSPDPSEDVTPTSDNYIIGTNIGSCYDNNLTTTYYLTSPEIDCSELEDVYVRYYSNLGYEGNFWDHVSLEVTDKAGNWKTIFKEGISNYNDVNWIKKEYNVRLYADKNPHFRVRFGIGPTDGSVQYKGWNIDDFEVYGNKYVTCTSSETHNTMVYDSIIADPGKDTAICLGQQVTLQGKGGENYLWYPATGLNNSSVAYPVASPKTTTSYTLTVTYKACSASNSVIVKVNPLPEANAGNDMTICNGSSCRLLAKGGTSYSWSPSVGLSSANTAFTQAFPSLTTTYIVTVTDANKCSATDDVIVYVNSKPSVKTSSDVTICMGDSTKLSASGGNIYKWSPKYGLNDTIGPNVIATPIITTTYNVDVTDFNGCNASGKVVVNVNPLPVVITNKNISICNGDTAKLSVSGGTGYMWAQDISMGTTIDGKTIVFPDKSTVYTVTVTDKGCYSTATVNITVFPSPVANGGADRTICQGDSILLKANGGMNYIWTPSDGLNNANINNPVAKPTINTTYSVQVIDANGCKATDYVSVTVNTPTGYAGHDITICKGDTARLYAFDGITYRWYPSVGLSDANIFNPVVVPISTTTYNVLITNSFGCVKTDNVVINVNSLPFAGSVKDTTICYGDSITLNAPSAVKYLWSPSLGLSSGNSQNPIAKPSGTITYNLTVTDDNGCKAKNSIIVRVNKLPVAEAGNNILVCKGDSITLNGSGGQTYTWTNSPEIRNISKAQTKALPLSSTKYTLTVKDINGCSSADNVNITVYDLPKVSAGNDTTICMGTGVVINATGGIYYNWSPKAGLNFSYLQSPLANPKNTTTYVVTVTDINGCSAKDDIVVKVNSLPVANAGADVTICHGAKTTLNATGGTKFKWAGLNLSDPDISNPVATPFYSTKYQVTVSDISGCSATDEVQVKVNELPQAEAGKDTYICLGESISLNASGGLTYKWSGTGLNNYNISNPVAKPSLSTTYYMTVTDKNNCSSKDSTIVFINPLPNANAGGDKTICYGSSIKLNATGGSFYSWSPATGLDKININNPVTKTTQSIRYYVTVTNLLGCKSKDSLNITVNPLPQADAGNNITICKGQKALLHATGGISYNWSGNNLDNTSIANPWATPIANSKYYLTVTDKNNCSQKDSLIISVNPLPKANAGNDVTICKGSNTSLVASGGISYSWSSITGHDTVKLSTSDYRLSASPTVTTTYILTVSDKNNCSSSDDVIVNVNQLPKANAGPDVNICKGKSATLNATGGAKYAWLPAYGLSKADTSSPVANPTFTITYIVTVTDANNCKNKDTIIVKVNDNPIVDAGKDIVMCPNSQVNLIAKAQNVKGTVKYLWTPNTDLNTDNISNPIARPANSISYTIMITDGNNCTATDNIFVRVQPKTTVELGMDTAICKGDTMRFNCPKFNGAKYQWSPVIRLTNPKIPNPGVYPLVKTRYYLTVTDSVGCRFFDSIMVNVKDVPKVDIGADQTICKGSKTTFAALGEFSCHWAPTTCLSSTSIFNPVASPATTTTYYLTVTDDNNCTATDKIVVNVISVEKPVIKASKGTGFCDSSLVFTNLDAGTGYKTYSWSTGSSTQNINISSAGDYWVKVSGQGACQVTSDTLKIIVFTKSPKPEIMINGKSEFCAGERVNLYVKNSFKAYHWSSGSTTDSIKVFQAGKYVVTVTDINNCVLVSAPKVIKVDLKPIAMFDYILKDSLRVDFVNRSVNGLNYAWTFGTEGKDSVSDPVFYFKNEGNRMITLKTDNACGTSIDSMTIWVYKRIPFGIDEVSSVNSFNVYPNPATDFINISYSKERIENSYIMIIDPIGQVILRERLTDNLSQFNKSYNVKGLAEGIYMIRLINDSLTKSVRVIVTK